MTRCQHNLDKNRMQQEFYEFLMVRAHLKSSIREVHAREFVSVASNGTFYEHYDDNVNKNGFLCLQKCLICHRYAVSSGENVSWGDNRHQSMLPDINLLKEKYIS